MKRALFALAVSSLCALAGCSSRVTPFGPGQAVQLAPEEQRMWDASIAEFDALSSSAICHRDPRLQEYVESVLERLLSHNRRAYLPLQPRICIVDVPVVNAACWPSGDIVIHTAILGRIRNEAQLAMLLGHELTHATHRHAHRKQDQLLAASGAVSYAAVLSSVVSADLAKGVQGIGGVITRAAVEGYGRDLERESDRVGLTLVAQAGYDPRVAAQLFERLLAAADESPKKGSTLLFYASHPKMTERVADSKRLAQQLDPRLIADARDVGEDPYVTICRELILDEAERDLALGRYELVSEAVTFLQRTSPSDARAAVLNGEVARQQGDHAAARVAYEAALGKDASAAGAHRGLGLIAAKEGRGEDAVRNLHRYLQLAPSAADRGFIESYIQKLEK